MPTNLVVKINTFVTKLVRILLRYCTYYLAHRGYILKTT